MGAKELVQACDRADLRREEFEGYRYRRVNHIRYLMQKNLLDENLLWREPLLV